MQVPADLTLHTERLMLRAADFRDIDLVWDASRFEGFNDGMTWDPPETRDELTQITQRNRDDWREGKCYIFTVCTQNTNIAIGRVGLHKEAERNTWNIGFWVHPDHWGKGYAPEAARAVLGFGFETLNAEKIETDHATWNAGSQSVIESLGFEFVRENPAGFYKNAKAVAVLEYVLTVNGAREGTEVQRHMRLAMEEGRKAIAECADNPPVGCVLVLDGIVIAKGHTNPPGKPHAEAMAINQLETISDDVEAYVTLEPCSFHGRTPSCAEALINAGIKRVYVGMLDPDSRNNGRGIARLREAGIEVHVGVLEQEIAVELRGHLGKAL